MRLFVLLICSLLISVVAVASDEYLFEITVSEKKFNSVWKVEEKNNQRYLYSNVQGATRTAVNNSDGETTAFTIEDDKNDIHIKVSTIGDHIFSYGIFKGKNISKTVKPEKGKPIYQHVFMQGGSFALSGEKETEITMLRPFDFETMVMKLENKGTETLEVLGEKIQAVRVEMRMAGLFSLFWSADFWFRLSDGMGIKYKGPQGPPGSPEVNMNLIKETHK